MSTNAVTPNPTPAAPPPAAAPAAPAAPAPSTAAVTPAAPAATPATPKTMEQRLSEGWAHAVEQVKKDTETPEQKTEPKTEPTPEVKTEPAEATPAAEKTEPVEQPEAKTEPAAEATPELQFAPIDDSSVLNPKQFADELKKSPDAEKFFNENPELKNSVMAALRRDSENIELRQIIPNVETARVVAQGAATYQKFDNHFLSATTPEGVGKFMDMWMREAMIVDAEGKPLMDGNGRYQFHPALQSVFSHVVDMRLNKLDQIAKKNGDTQLEAAVSIIREATSPSFPALDDKLPDELKPYAESLKAREDKLKAEQDKARQEESSRQQVANEAAIERVEASVATSLISQLKTPFAKAGMSDWEQKKCAEEIGDRLDQKLESNPLYQSIRDSILMQPPSEERDKRLMKHMLTYYQQYVGPITSEVIREAKAGHLQRQTATQEKVNAQETASKTDPKGASITPSSPQAQKTNKEIRDSIIADYKAKHNGQEPDMNYVMAEAFKIVTAPINQRK